MTRQGNNYHPSSCVFKARALVFSYHKSLLWPGASHWRIYYHRMCGQLSTTCSNLRKWPNGELLVAGDHNQQQTMASGTVDPVDWYESVQPQSQPSIDFATLQPSACEATNHLAYAATQGIKVTPQPRGQHSPVPMSLQSLPGPRSASDLHLTCQHSYCCRAVAYSHRPASISYCRRAVAYSHRPASISYCRRAVAYSRRSARISYCRRAVAYSRRPASISYCRRAVAYNSRPASVSYCRKVVAYSR